MGYAKGVRPGGHAGGHLREPALELLEAIWHDETRWWEVDSGNGVPFESAEAAYRTSAGSSIAQTPFRVTTGRWQRSCWGRTTCGPMPASSATCAHSSSAGST